MSAAAGAGGAEMSRTTIPSVRHNLRLGVAILLAAMIVVPAHAYGPGQKVTAATALDPKRTR
jgi:hypothetical protein